MDEADGALKSSELFYVYWNLPLYQYKTQYSLSDANIQASWAPMQCVVSITVLWIKKEDTIAADPSASVEKEMEQLTTMR